MKKNKILFVLWALCFSVIQTNAQTPLSFEESLHLLNQGNQSLKIADKGIEIAKAERDKLNAFWYPTLQSTGAFVHMSEKIEVKQPLSQFTDPAKDFVHSIIPDDQIISSILDKIGANTLVFPLTPRNLTTVDLSAEWVLFSGGKRSLAFLIKVLYTSLTLMSFVVHFCIGMTSKRPNKYYILSLGEWNIIKTSFSNATPKDLFIKYYNKIKR